MTSDSSLEKAIELRQAGQYEKARGLLVRLIKRNPKQSEVWYQLSFCVESEAQKRDCLRRALKLNPIHVEARAELKKLDQVTANPPFILDPANEDFVNGRSPQIGPTEQQIQGLVLTLMIFALLAFFVTVIPLFVRIFIFAFVTFIGGGVGWYLRRRQKLINEGQLLQGTVLSCEADYDGDNDFVVTIEYSFTTPSGLELKGKEQATREDLIQRQGFGNPPIPTDLLPVQNTPVYVLYADDKTFALM